MTTPRRPAPARNSLALLFFFLLAALSAAMLYWAASCGMGSSRTTPCRTADTNVVVRHSTKAEAVLETLLRSEDTRPVTKHQCLRAHETLELFTSSSSSSSRSTTKMSEASCRRRAKSGENVIYERLLQFAVRWDRENDARRRRELPKLAAAVSETPSFFCDVMRGGPKGFKRWHEDVFVARGDDFSWKALLSRLNASSSSEASTKRPQTLILRFEGGKNFCEMLDERAMERDLFPSDLRLIVLGPFGDGSNFGPFSGGIGSPYFRHRPLVTNFESIICPGKTWNATLRLLDSPHLVAWLTFSQNFEHSKLISVPLGTEHRYWESNIRTANRTALVTKRHLLALTFSPGYNSRTEWIQALEGRTDVKQSSLNPWAPSVRRLPAAERDALFDAAGLTFQESKIVVCPGGLGIDTKRPFEALLAGAVPMMLSHTGLTRTYRRLPVHFVDSLDRLGDLEERYLALACGSLDREYRFEKLTWSGWRDFVHRLKAASETNDDGSAMRKVLDEW